MYQYQGMEDTIAAIATPSGQGGIGIVRISGKDAVAAADAVVRLQGGKALTQCQSHTVHHGWVIDPQSGNIVDEVLAVLMKAPRSYTGEDVVEIHGHGGMAVMEMVLKLIITARARLASPGEFTKRAFLNGRMDLTQAEAVIDVINAKTEMFLRQSQFHLKGELSMRLNGIREELVQTYTMLEALINFPDEGIDAESREQILNRLGRQEAAVSDLLKGSQGGRILREGIRIVLCGKPNVGKSSLLNALLKEQRAIVTDIAGTTRDVLEEPAKIKGIPVCLVDTAGILTPRDLIEEEAVKRSRFSIKNADLVLLILDNSRPLEDQDQLLLDQLKTAPVMAVVNKMDLEDRIDTAAVESIFGKEKVVKVSALRTDCVQQLEEKIVEIIAKNKHLDSRGLLISNIRHIKSLEHARKSLQGARRLMDEDVSFEFVSEEIKAAVNQLDAVTGRNIDEDLLDRIFSSFCIGK